MTWTTNGKNYVCQKYGNTAECVVSQAVGLTFNYTDVLGESYTGMTGSTAEIVGFVISGLIDTITMTNPSRPLISNPQAAINNANGSAINMADAQSLIQHDENSGDQWCYGGGGPTGSAAFTICPSVLNGAMTAYFTWQGAIQPTMDDIAYMYIQRPDTSKAAEYVEDTYGQTSGNHLLNTTVNQTGTWKAHIDIANGPGVWVVYEAICQVGGSECNAYLPFLFEFKVTNAAGTTITTAKTGDTVRLYARIARFASDPCAHYDLTFYTDSVAKTGQISQLSGDTYASDATGGEWVYKTWLIPHMQPLGSFPHFGVVETNTDEDVEQAFSITCFDSCACETETQCVAPCNWCTTPATAHCQTAACGTTETDCSLITDPDLCIMPTCFWYKDYIWETGEGATCHSLEEMLKDNWFIPVGVGAVIIYLLIK